MGVQPAEAAEVGTGPHGASGQDDKGLALTPYVVRETGPVPGGEDRHAVDPRARRRRRATGFAEGRPFRRGKSAGGALAPGGGGLTY
ncbi:hypothetical protein GCM10010266_22040 [Streptomyces griseomycini]|nr:hypothetical protein GCM10010266_22040 [Streptomyces griseomycini]GGR08000.1 hypothetical protein GCM10015536_11400 [Streptomyces griseomycini]